MRDRLTREEATERAERVAEVEYDLNLSLEQGAETYRGEVVVRFRGEEETFLDWSGDRLERFEVNGRSLERGRHPHRLLLPGEALEERNEVRVGFQTAYDHGGEGFHQFFDPEDGAEYLYTQFEPFKAHRLFPCFDQPDLKARYRLQVDAPASWTVIANSAEEGREGLPEGRSRRRFQATAPFSPYLVAVVAGPYRGVEDTGAEVPLGLWCRESYLPYLEADELFQVTRQGLDFYSAFFDHPYPFGKYDQIFCPEFNWGGMENVGAVVYSDEHLLYRDRPTATQRLRRAEVFLHELAHMWFGDLVTMRWWDDLWLNETFATYMAYLALAEATDFEGSWEHFLSRMKVWAYEADELVTTHRIADRVPSTDETFLNFDGITYGKGAAVIKQLVKTIGPEAFREGMRSYFRRHAFGNATLGDFLAALEEGSGLDLDDWAKRWLETASLNALRSRREDGRLFLVQTAPPEHPVLRPHSLEVALVGDELSVVEASIDGEEQEVALPAPPPDLVIPNHGDHAYAKLLLDPPAFQAALPRLGSLQPPLLRQILWTSLWSMVRDGRISSRELLDLVHRHLPAEDDLHVLEMVVGITAGDFSARSVAPPVLHHYVPDRWWAEECQRMVESAWRALEEAVDPDIRSAWARVAIGQAVGEEDLRRAGRLVDEGMRGLTITQEMRWETAVRWAAFDVEGARGRLEGERRRDTSDRGERAVVRAEASRPEPRAKEEAWRRIHQDDWSLHLKLAAARGFRWRHQRELLQPYVERFFSGLPEVFSTWQPESARRYFQVLFPSYRADQEVVERSRAVLEQAADRNPILRRLLLEAIDRTERAITCRRRAGD